MEGDTMWIVYKHTSPVGKVYIGITHQKPEKRWQKGYGYKENPHFYSAIQKYGWDNFKHEILFDNLTQKEAETKEIELITQYQSNNRTYGYNISSGGGINYPSEEGLQRLKDLWTGHVVPEETRRKISETQKGKIIPLETRLKMSASRKGRKRSPEAIQKTIEGRQKPVQCIETGEVFKCMKDAQTKYNTNHIHDVCKGYRKVAGGYHWQYYKGGGQNGC